MGEGLGALGGLAGAIELVAAAAKDLTQLEGASRFLLAGALANLAWRAWIAESTSVMNCSTPDVVIPSKFRNSNKGAERCELYIFSILVVRPPMDESMLLSKFESASTGGVPTPVPLPMPVIQSLMFIVVGGVVAMFSYSKPPNLLLETGASRDPVQ